MNLKTIVKSLFKIFGLDVVWYTPELNRPFNILPLLIKERLALKVPFFFVQVGANDGVLDDPLRDLILEHNLTGLLVEPLPDMFETLKENYRSQNELFFENIAISDVEGGAVIYRVRKDADVPYGFHGLASFSRSHLRKEGAQEKDIEECRIRTSTFSKVFEKYNIKHITLLQIDTEGYDFEIIKLAFSCGIRPEIINYEHCHLRPAIKYECKKFLDANDYMFIEVGKDTIAVSKDTLN